MAASSCFVCGSVEASCGESIGTWKERAELEDGNIDTEASEFPAINDERNCLGIDISID